MSRPGVPHPERLSQTLLADFAILLVPRRLEICRLSFCGIILYTITLPLFREILYVNIVDDDDCFYYYKK